MCVVAVFLRRKRCQGKGAYPCQGQKGDGETTRKENLAIFMKVDNPTAPTLSPDLARREKYLEREIGGLASDWITVTKFPTALEEDVTCHLNDQGTVDLIDYIDGIFTSDLIMNPAYSERKDVCGRANRIQIWMQDLPQTWTVCGMIRYMHRL